ncbi:selenocysteine-specific translation elongation factor [Lachnospiraceae bacterium OttesenSCG-928-J05]|nr:selenocysteine-specific translation elongation factor [Lachnospiraceae bacterium OttesenSCG-928-J05]
MKHIIVGTAGHIDHGKTTLIRALTGRNTDRLEEEQRRGITIDLGFTYFDLAKDKRVGIIDVPGHEKFVGNMVAGVVGMDLVLLVIAADEGIMPQTREHMDILHLLGIDKCIVVLNKCDLVDEEWLELVRDEIKEEFAGTFLEKAPVVCVSAATGAGIPQLSDEIDQMTTAVAREATGAGVPRLPVDRVFTLSGFGTVVTGTLIAGHVKKEDLMMVYPGEQECRIRSLQVHGENAEEVAAGQRVAVNISNLKKKEIKRGAVLAKPNSMKATDLLDVKLEMLPSSLRVLTTNMRLHFFTGTSEVLARAVLLEGEEIGPGESAYVTLRLEEKIAVRNGDRFVVRFYSPLETIGGGVILEANPASKKRDKAKVAATLKKKEAGDPRDVVLLQVAERGHRPLGLQELAKALGSAPDEVKQYAKELEGEERLVILSLAKEEYYLEAEQCREMEREVIASLTAYEEKYPYRYGQKKAEVLTALFKGMKPGVFDALIERMVAAGEIKRQEEYLSTIAFEIKEDETYTTVRQRLLSAFDAAKYDFIRYRELDFGKISEGVVDDILQVLVVGGEVVKINDDFFTLASLMDGAKTIVEQQLAADGVITIAQVRDLFHTSRKSAKPILEYMDGIKVTKKTGGESERVAFK